MDTKELASGRQGIYRLNLSIGLVTERTEEIDIDQLVDDWENLTDEEFEEALHAAWKEWAWEYIDGGAVLQSEQ